MPEYNVPDSQLSRWELRARRWLERHPKINARIGRAADKLTEVKWEPFHNGVAYGKNAVGDQFMVATKTKVRKGEPTVRLIQIRPCPEGRWGCGCANRLCWTGDDVDYAMKRANFYARLP